ncbi:MAG TPA: sodium/proton-translocating pyrophosphatase, partial [Candidatus Andersenbacteria bacterium]|nr:sodium/proton-translocating pyrophosphatase [Candidatus Andersenbacteria bacterium]
MNALVIALATPVLGLVFVSWLLSWIMKKDQGTPAMIKVAEAIRAGARAFLYRQYRTIGLISVLVAAGLWIAYTLSSQPQLAGPTAVAFLLGAASSAVSGIIGMSIAVRT